MNKKFIILSSIVVLVVAGAVLVISNQHPTKPSAAVKPTPVSGQPKPSAAPLSTPPSAASTSTPRLLIGSPTAKLTIIQYSDPQCPLCKRFFEQTEPLVRKEYIDTGKANLEVRVETHIGAGSELAGQGWYCAADQGKFEALHDATFKNQDGGFDTAKLKTLASSAGLDTAAFGSCLDSHKYAETVQASDKESKSKISGTPTFFIGTQKIVGAQPIGVFRPVINSQLQ